MMNANDLALAAYLQSFDGTGDEKRPPQPVVYKPSQTVMLTEAAQFRDRTFPKGWCGTVVSAPRIDGHVAVLFDGDMHVRFVGRDQIKRVEKAVRS